MYYALIQWFFYEDDQIGHRLLVLFLRPNEGGISVSRKLVFGQDDDGCFTSKQPAFDPIAPITLVHDTNADAAATTTAMLLRAHPFEWLNYLESICFFGSRLFCWGHKSHGMNERVIHKPRGNYRREGWLSK